MPAIHTWSYGAPVSSHAWLNAGGGLRPWHVLRQPRKDPRSWRRAVCCNPWATDPYLEHLELRSYGVPSHGTRFASQANIHDHVAAQCAATPGLRNPWELMRYSFLGVTHAMRPSCNNSNNNKDKTITNAKLDFSPIGRCITFTCGVILLRAA